MKLFGAILMVALSASVVMAECACGETGFYYTVVNPDDTEFMEDFLWEVAKVEPVYDLTDPAEPVVTCRVEVNFVYEDNPAVETLDYQDEAVPLLFGEQWMSFIQFEESMLRDECLVPMS